MVVLDVGRTVRLWEGEIEEKKRFDEVLRRMGSWGFRIHGYIQVVLDEGAREWGGVG